MCDSAGIMYFGNNNKIEKANLDGTGRAILQQRSRYNYISFVYHAGNIYFTAVLAKYDDLL